MVTVIASWLLDRRKVEVARAFEGGLRRSIDVHSLHENIAGCYIAVSPLLYVHNKVGPTTVEA